MKVDGGPVEPRMLGQNFAEFVKAESDKWKKVVTDANLKAE
jgi:hypothetical protein